MVAKEDITNAAKHPHNFEYTNVEDENTGNERRGGYSDLSKNPGRLQMFRGNVQIAHYWPKIGSLKHVGNFKMGHQKNVLFPHSGLSK